MKILNKNFHNKINLKSSSPIDPIPKPQFNLSISNQNSLL